MALSKYDNHYTASFAHGQAHETSALVLRLNDSFETECIDWTIFMRVDDLVAQLAKKGPVAGGIFHVNLVVPSLQIREQFSCYIDHVGVDVVNRCRRVEEWERKLREAKDLYVQLGFVESTPQGFMFRTKVADKRAKLEPGYQTPVAAAAVAVVEGAPLRAQAVRVPLRQLYAGRTGPSMRRPLRFELLSTPAAPRRQPPQGMRVPLRQLYAGRPAPAVCHRMEYEDEPLPAVAVVPNAPARRAIVRVPLRQLFANRPGPAVRRPLRFERPVVASTPPQENRVLPVPQAPRARVFRQPLRPLHIFGFGKP